MVVVTHTLSARLGGLGEGLLLICRLLRCKSSQASTVFSVDCIKLISHLYRTPRSWSARAACDCFSASWSDQSYASFWFCAPNCACVS